MDRNEISTNTHFYISLVNALPDFVFQYEMNILGKFKQKIFLMFDD